MVTVNIASTPDREKELYHTVFSLLDQVDKVNICLNNYTHNPFAFMDMNSHKVNVIFKDNELGDAGRYYFLEETEGWFFTCDDDIIYPKYYCEDTIQRMVNNNYKYASYHGRNFDNFPLESYYNDACKKYRCLEEVKEDVKVQFAGTGVSCFHTSNFKPSIDIFERSNMSDIFMGIESQKKNIDLICLSHEKDYFRYQEVPNTIYDAKCKDDKIETEIININYDYKSL